MNIFKKIGNWWSPPAAPAPPPEPIPSATHVSSLCEAIIRATARDPIVTAHAEELSKNWNVLKTQSSLTDDLRTKMEHAAAKLYSLGLQTLLPEITLDKLEKLYSSLETQLPTPTTNFTDLTLKVNELMRVTTSVNLIIDSPITNTIENVARLLYEIYEKIPHNIATDGRKPPIPEYLSKLENLNFESMYDKLEHNDPLPLTTIERTTFTNKIVLVWADIESHPPIDLEIAKKTLLIVYTLQHNQPPQPQLMKISDYISARLPIETHQDRIPTIIRTAAAPVTATPPRATPATASGTRTIPPPPPPGFKPPIPKASSSGAPPPPPRPRDPPTGVGAGAGSTAIPGPATARLVSAEAPAPGSSSDFTTPPSEVGVLALALAEFAKATNPTYRGAKLALGDVMNLMRQQNCLSLAGAHSVGKMCRNLMKAISHLPEADQTKLFREEKDNITLILSFGMRGLILDARALLGKVAQYKGSMGLDDAKEYESYCFYVKFITQFYGNPPKSPLLESCNAILAYLKSIYLANRSRQPLIKPFSDSSTTAPTHREILTFETNAFSALYENLAGTTRPYLTSIHQKLEEINVQLTIILSSRTTDPTSETVKMKTMLTALKLQLFEMHGEDAVNLIGDIDGILTNLTRIEAEHILNLITGITTSLSSQYTVPSFNSSGTFIRPTVPGEAPSCHSCAFIALYNLYTCLEQDTSFNLDDSIYKALSRHHAAIRAYPALLEEGTDPPIPSFVHSDVAAPLFEGLLTLQSTSAKPLTLGNEIEIYTNQLALLKTCVDEYPSKRAGALIHKGDTFYSVVMKKIAESPPRYSITIMDSHGFEESAGAAAHVTGKAFSLTFDKIEDAAKCLYVRTPYKLTTSESNTLAANQCTFEIFTKTDPLTPAGSEALAADAAFLARNKEEARRTEGSLGSRMPI